LYFLRSLITSIEGKAAKGKWTLIGVGVGAGIGAAEPSIPPIATTARSGRLWDYCMASASAPPAESSSAPPNASALWSTRRIDLALMENGDDNNSALTQGEVD